MRGVSARLDSPDARTRRHGQKVAIALAAAVDPSRPLTFRDDEDFGAGDAADDDDVSENEAEWEKDAKALRGDEFECAVDADANDADANDADANDADANDADAFVASLIGDSAETREGKDRDGNVDGDGDGDGTVTGTAPPPPHAPPPALMRRTRTRTIPTVWFAWARARARARPTTSTGSPTTVRVPARRIRRVLRLGASSSDLEPYDMSEDDSDSDDDLDLREAAATDRVARAAARTKATRRRLAALPKPASLSTCAEGASADAGETNPPRRNPPSIAPTPPRAPCTPPRL